jgi:hypothetical protein
VAYGDKLCKDLYGTSWSATLLFKDATLVKQYISGLEEYTIHYPEHLGKKHTDAMKTLGYAVPEQEPLADDTLPGIQSLAELEQDLFASFVDIIDFVCFSETLNTSATYIHELLFKKRKVAH